MGLSGCDPTKSQGRPILGKTEDRGEQRACFREGIVVCSSPQKTGTLGSWAWGAEEKAMQWDRKKHMHAWREAVNTRLTKSTLDYFVRSPEDFWAREWQAEIGRRKISLSGFQRANISWCLWGVCGHWEYKAGEDSGCPWGAWQRGMQNGLNSGEQELELG